jgi:hypothetical protein
MTFAMLVCLPLALGRPATRTAEEGRTHRSRPPLPSGLCAAPRRGTPWRDAAQAAAARADDAGGVGFQVGLDDARRKQLKALRQAAARARPAPEGLTTDVVEQLKGLKALHDDGVLSPEEFQMAKRKVLGG